MTRHLLNLLTAASLLLCVAMAALWVRSYFRSDWLSYTRVGRQPGVVRSEDVQLLSSGGSAWVALTREEFAPAVARGGDAGWAYEADAPEDASDRIAHRVLGFGYENSEHWPNPPNPPSYHQRRVEFPLWFATVLLGAAPLAALLRKLRRRHAAAAGRCPSCGYDLTGNVSGVCPECGSER